MKQLIQVHLVGGAPHYVNPDRIIEVYDVSGAPTVIRLAGGGDTIGYGIMERAAQVNDMISIAGG